MSKFQEKYASKGFTVIAVNGYDEEKDVVQKFADKEKLKQPILLKGSKVAFELYGVTGFPASFWIDPQGNIVHREVGFSPELAPALEKRIEKLLSVKTEAAKAESKGAK